MKWKFAGQKIKRVTHWLTAIEGCGSLDPCSSSGQSYCDMTLYKERYFPSDTLHPGCKRDQEMVRKTSTNAMRLPLLTVMPSNNVQILSHNENQPRSTHKMSATTTGKKEKCVYFASRTT